MSDTPQTDAELDRIRIEEGDECAGVWFYIDGKETDDVMTIRASFVYELEGELAAARAECEDAKSVQEAQERLLRDIEQQLAEARADTEMLKHLYTTRKDRVAAKQARAEKAEKVGKCYGSDDREYCFHLHSNPDDWCDVCRAKKPFQEDFIKKSGLAAVALRRCMARGKKAMEESK